METISRWFAAIAIAVLSPLAAAESSPLVEVWRSPNCGCCGEWIKHLQKNGFRTKVHMTEDARLVGRGAGIPDRLASCHTAKVGGYALEGHVPAREIRRLLAGKPKAAGLTVPGMPQGSPGMEQGSAADSYEVLLVGRDGGTQVYQRY